MRIRTGMRPMITMRNMAEQPKEGFLSSKRKQAKRWLSRYV